MMNAIRKCITLVDVFGGEGRLSALCVCVYVCMSVCLYISLDLGGGHDNSRSPIVFEIRTSNVKVDGREFALFGVDCGAGGTVL